LKNFKKENNKIESEELRLSKKNQFDGNLVHGAKIFHERTNRSGKDKPSSGFLIREHAKVVYDNGADRFQRTKNDWEMVDNCPVCNSNKKEFVFSRFGLDIYSCIDCTHKYMAPRIKFEVLENLYKDDKTASDIYTKKMQIEIDEIKYNYGLEIIEKLNLKHNKIMDIGCGAGVFLKEAYKRGWQDCVGVDINERYRDIYKKDKGVQFINRTFEGLSDNDLGEDYDCISLWSVLEHLYDLKSIIQTIKKLLNKDGLLFILVPNAHSLATNLMRSMSPTFGWKHVSHFSPKSLVKLMDLNGFSCIFHETVITEIDNIKSYMNGEFPYHGYGDPNKIFDFIDSEFIHSNMLGSRQIAIFKKNDS
jgi:2-polyprenyl-3-methyl-5-hydroxy-6-metoxy-1,4-benzoquinol methylase